MINWPDYKYRAFVSYSHADEKWARWLHRALENYRIPKRLVGHQTTMGKVPARLSPVFRDREELASATDLGDTLSKALESSAVLIVICSISSAKSHWVNEEIKAFKQMGRSDRIFSLIVEGEPYASDQKGYEHFECFPPALRFKLGEDGELSTEPAEPIAADARQGKDGKANARVKLIAGILGLGFDDLRQRELQRRNRRLAIISGSAVVGMILAIALATTAFIARNEAQVQRARAESEAETVRQTADFMVSLFEVSDPSEARGRSVTAREILRAGAERVETELAEQPEIQARLMNTIGSVFSSLGLFNDARSMLEPALANRRALPGVSDQELVDTLLNLAHVDTESAESEAAEALYNEAIERLDSTDASDNLDMSNALAGLAQLYYRTGRFEDAQPLLERVLADRRRLLGDTNAEVADAIEELGLNQFDQGKLEEAEGYLRESLSMRRQLLGDQPHPDLAENLFNLGQILIQQGQVDEVEVLYEEAIAMLRRLYPDNHPSLAMGLTNLGGFYRLQGHLDKATVACTEALNMSRELFGESHPEVAVMMVQLSYVHYQAGDLPKAIGLSREALTIQTDTLGGDHPEVGANMTTLGRWLGESGSVDEGQALLSKALAIFAESLPPGHLDVARAEVELAELLLVQEKYEESLDLARRGTDSLVKAIGTGHWLAANGRSVQGAALAGLGQLDEAERLLRSSAEQMGADEGARSVYVMAAQRRLQQFYSGVGKP